MRRFNTVLILTALVRIQSEKPSGFYLRDDDGKLIAQDMDEQQRDTIKTEFMHLLFDEVDAAAYTRRSELLAKRSAPRFLLNIYNEAFSAETFAELTTTSSALQEFGLTDDDIRAINRSDVIRTFSAYEPEAAASTIASHGDADTWFNMTDVSNDREIVLAELRFYREATAERANSHVPYVVSVHRATRAKNGVRATKYVNSVNVTTYGWITVNVSQAVSHWLQRPKSNRGLVLAVHRPGHEGADLTCHDIGIVGVLGAPDKQPFIVVFFDAKRPWRSMDGAKTKRERVLDRDTADHDGDDDSSRMCKRYTLYVSFTDLNWDWVIAPRGYDAGFCSGECDFPLNDYVNTTNHAVIQAMAHILHPEAVPKPSCVATSLSPVSMIYFVDDDRVVLKTYDNMTVDRCGCW